jgi:hypothetical protein
MGNHAALICLPALLAVAYGADRDPAQVLADAQAKVAARAATIPNYTCVETVDRNFYRPIGATLPRACSTWMAQRPAPTLD